MDFLSKARPHAFVRASLIVLVACLPARALAFKEQGHRSIEAAAYRALLDQGYRDVLVRLIKAEILLGRHPNVNEKALTDRRGAFSTVEPGYEQVDGIWLGSHLPDHSYEHQLESYGQCYHFQARTNDVVARPRNSVRNIPVRMSRDAYARCMYLLDILFRGVVYDPIASRKNHADVYTLIHIVEDSFSDAHAARTIDWKIDHLKPWRLRSWSTYLVQPYGWRYHVTDSHHGVMEDRDYGYLDRKNCEHKKDELVGTECLSARGRKAADAVAELLIVLAKHASCHEQQGGRRRTCPEIDQDWNEYKKKYFAHVDAEISSFEPDKSSGTMADVNVATRTFGTDLVGSSAYLARKAAPSIGLGLGADLAQASQSLWLTADVFLSRDPSEADSLSLFDVFAYSVQLRLPIETSDGQRPAGLAGEFGARLPFNFLSVLPTSSKAYISMHVGVRARGEILVAKSDGATRAIYRYGFSGAVVDFVLYRNIWLGFEGPRKVWSGDTLGPDRWETYWSVKAGVALNALAN